MNNNRRGWLIGGVLLVLAALTVLFFSNQKPRFDWRETYWEQSKEPYGTYIIADLLKQYFPKQGFKILKDSLNGALPMDSNSNTINSYVFIGERPFYDSIALQALLQFVENGNTAFISSRTIPANLMDYLPYEECEIYEWNDYDTYDDTLVNVNFDNVLLNREKGFSFKYIQKSRVRQYGWSHIPADYFCESALSFKALGWMNDSLIHFASVPYGDGTFYFHTIPLAFSNIAMLDSNALQHANRVFSYLPEGKIYWDEYSKTMGFPESGLPNRTVSSNSPLRYVLSQPPLAWAWYLLLAMGSLFLLFRTKRKQRVIPVLETNTNTSLAFVSTIGRLYFLQNNHKQLALQKMKLFLQFVRERYHLRVLETDAAFQQKLIAKSEVSSELVENIFKTHKTIYNSYGIYDNYLVEFHQLLEDFYKKCK